MKTCAWWSTSKFWQQRKSVLNNILFLPPVAWEQKHLSCFFTGVTVLQLMICQKQEYSGFHWPQKLVVLGKKYSSKEEKSLLLCKITGVARNNKDPSLYLKKLGGSLSRDTRNYNLLFVGLLTIIPLMNFYSCQNSASHCNIWIKRDHAWSILVPGCRTSLDED